MGHARLVAKIAYLTNHLKNVFATQDFLLLLDSVKFVMPELVTMEQIVFVIQVILEIEINAKNVIQHVADAKDLKLINVQNVLMSL